MHAHRSLSFREIAELFRTDQQKARKSIAALFGRRWPRISGKPPVHTALIAEHLGQLFYKNIPERSVPSVRIAHTLLNAPRKELRMVGAIVVGEYGRKHPAPALALLKKYLPKIDPHAGSYAFKRIAEKHPDSACRMLHALVFSRHEHVRTFLCEAFRASAATRMPISRKLSIAHWLMKDSALPVKRMLGETLKSLSRAHPDAVFEFLTKEVSNGNLHTYWIAYRACEGLVKKKDMHARVLSLLNISTYHIPR